MKLSIILPVYNVEEYIGPCLESVFRQGLDSSDFEVIVINDGTRDRSMEIVNGIKDTHNNIIVVEQQNQGLSAARNNGLDNASGEYILFLDSDDLLVSGTLPHILQTAIQSDADMAIADFVKMDNEEIARSEKWGVGGERSHKQQDKPLTSHSSPPTPNISPLTSGKDYFLGEFNPQQCYVWRTLYKRSFLQTNGLRFITGIYFEDVPFTTECCLRAGRCVRVRQTFYIYRQRPNSIVSSLSMKKLTDFNTVLSHLMRIKGELCCTPMLHRRMDDTVFTTFSIAVWYLTHDKALLADRRTFIDDLHSKIGRLNCKNGIKQRLVSLFFSILPDTYIRLRSL